MSAYLAAAAAAYVSLNLGGVAYGISVVAVTLSGVALQRRRRGVSARQ